MFLSGAGVKVGAPPALPRGSGRCSLCGEFLWQSEWKGCFTSVVLAWLSRCSGCVVRLQVLEELPPGALGTMLAARLKTDEGAQKKYAIKQVSRWLLRKQEFGVFVISRGTMIVTRDPCWAAQLLGKGRLAHYCAAFWENQRFRSA